MTTLAEALQNVLRLCDEALQEDVDYSERFGNIPEELRHLGSVLDDEGWDDSAEVVRAGAAHIEKLLEANTFLLRRVELTECSWCGYHGTPDGQAPEDEGPKEEGPSLVGGYRGEVRQDSDGRWSWRVYRVEPHLLLAGSEYHPPFDSRCRWRWVAARYARRSVRYWSRQADGIVVLGIEGSGVSYETWKSEWKEV